MEIIIVPFIEGTPARTNRKTGKIYVSEFHFKKLDKTYQTFILLHEMAHYIFQTTDEQMCDEFATRVMLKKGFRLKTILKTINQTLTDSDNHHGRKINIKNLLEIEAFFESNDFNKIIKNIKNGSI